MWDLERKTYWQITVNKGGWSGMYLELKNVSKKIGKVDIMQIAAYYGRFCGAKRPQCGAERPVFLLI